jgi:hypothetical protein
MIAKLGEAEYIDTEVSNKQTLDAEISSSLWVTGKHEEHWERYESIAKCAD